MRQLRPVTHVFFFFLKTRRPPRSTLDRSSAASDVYKRQDIPCRISQRRRKGFRRKVRQQVVRVKVFPQERTNRAHQPHRPDRTERKENQDELGGVIDLAPDDSPLSHGSIGGLSLIQN